MLAPDRARSGTRILHVSPAFYPATKWGGPIYSLFGLCNALAEIPGVTLRVLTTNAAGPALSESIGVTEFPKRYAGGYEVLFCRRYLGASFSPGLMLRLWSTIRWSDVVHLTGVYSSPTIPTLLMCRLIGRPVVWSPRGALQRWSGTTRQTPKKFWEIACDAVLAKGSCILHVTSDEEARESSSRIRNAGVRVIPNGVTIEESLPARDWCPGGGLRLLFIGRLHQKKGVENLLYALKTLGDDSVSLVICGGGNRNYELTLRRLASELGLSRVTFRGHVEGEVRDREFSLSDVCVVPSFTENFGMVIAEALAHGVPVIAGKGTPWSQLNSHDCGMWVDNSPATLASAIAAIRKRDLEKMGHNGREWMRRDFAWEVVARQMFSLYRESISVR